MDAPSQFTALAARYGQPSAKSALPTGPVKPPENDETAAALVQQTKAAIDAAGGVQNAPPAIRAHVKAVIAALETYASRNPKSVVAQKLMAAIRSDPALTPYL